MKLFKKFKEHKESRKKGNLVIKSGKEDIRVYPKGTLLNTTLKREE
ncbi:hypothetical protein [[Clostridium] innocuum]|nr:hypothetical protein [[Clostridium] innocuum]PWJ19749.1 hypothetical protein ATF84_101293 [[Clostridium] innocuum]SSA37471.1 hypothetical protein SAMN04487929_101293 [[Clostridium] innocuum]